MDTPHSDVCQSGKYDPLCDNPDCVGERIAEKMMQERGITTKIMGSKEDLYVMARGRDGAIYPLIFCPLHGYALAKKVNSILVCTPCEDQARLENSPASLP